MPTTSHALAVSVRPPWWPVTGCGYFLSHPRLWWGPLLATVIAYVAVLMVAVGLTWWTWPGAAVEGFWVSLGGSLMALTWGLLGALAAWLVILPLLVAYAFERLMVAVFRLQGTAVQEEGLVVGVVSALQVLWRMGIWMLVWPLMTLLLGLSGLLAPLAPLAAALGFAHLAVLEACDVALALRGYRGRQRWAALQQRRAAVMSAVLVAAGLSLLLGLTVIGGVLVLPAIFTGAALWVGQWPEAADGDYTSGSASRQRR